MGKLIEASMLVYIGDPGDPSVGIDGTEYTVEITGFGIEHEDRAVIREHLTNLAKGLFDHPRPYVVFDDELPTE